MKTKLENHPLVGRTISTIDGKPNADGNITMGIEAVYKMDLENEGSYICLLTWTPGNVPPQYRSHGQLEWENISLNADTVVGKLFLDAIQENRNKYKI